MKEWSCRRDSNVMAEEALKCGGQAKDQAMKVVCAAAEHARAVCIAEIAHCRQEILRICKLMKLRIFDTETNRIQSRIYYDPANV